MNYAKLPFKGVKSVNLMALMYVLCVKMATIFLEETGSYVKAVFQVVRYVKMPLSVLCAWKAIILICLL